MDQNNQPPMNLPISQNRVPEPTPAGMPPFQPPHEHKKIGPIVAILVIVLVLVIAAIYIFATQLNHQNPPTDTGSLAANPSSMTTSPVSDSSSATVPAATATPTVTPITNTKDDVQSLQNDLNNSTTGLNAQGF
jgi:cytoskeletal protein RodZ